MARPTGLSNTQIAAVRTVSGVIAADSATLTDANIDPTKAIDCRGFDTIWVGVEIAAGTNPTATIEALFRDLDAVDSGTAAASRWKRVLKGSRDGVTTVASPAAETTGALDGTAFVEVQVYGRYSVFLRITAVANPTSTTGITILAFGGRPRSAPF